MDIQLDTKLEVLDNNRTKASVHLDFASGGFTISNIIIFKADNGNWKMSFPLMQIKERKRPVVTLQGALKDAVVDAVSQDHMQLRASGEKSMFQSRSFQDNFAV